ncbi:MAG: type II toxin-antitoxin system RelE/ParE family toxin [Desulfobacterales bacterium]|nr:type II toxin-antitoxin system RelE/ParE family toxin [Desulfobacterales bacterium]
MNPYGVVFSRGARQDLLKIYRYIKNAGRPETARRLSKIITDTCQSLSENPERGHMPEEFKGIGGFSCRQLVLKRHRIIYEIIGRTVVIHGIIDGRRNISEVLRQRLLP